MFLTANIIVRQKYLDFFSYSSGNHNFVVSETEVKLKVKTKDRFWRLKNFVINILRIYFRKL